MKLSHKDCDNAKPKDKPYKLADGQGMYLDVRPNGSKYWRLRYRMHDKQKLLALGVFPETSLKAARDKRQEARKLLDQGVDPSRHKQDEKRKASINAKNTFEAVALEWHEIQKHHWSEKHAQTVLSRLNKDVFPVIGKRPISEISVPELLDVLRKIEKRGALDIAGRVKQICGQVFRYGIQTARCEHDPSHALKGALKTKKTEHFAALSPNEIPELLTALEKNDARLFPITRRAITFSMLNFLRPSEIVGARWDEIDWEAKEWNIPAGRMKGKRKHTVPLTRQAIEVLKEQHKETGSINTEWVFPSLTQPRKHLNKETLAKALWKLGFKGRMTAHGFRAMARTAIREKLGYEPDIIEAQLAHKPAGPLGAAYDRCRHLDSRKEMLQEWADWLDQAGGKNVIEGNFKKKAS